MDKKTKAVLAAVAAAMALGLALPAVSCAMRSAGTTGEESSPSGQAAIDARDVKAPADASEGGQESEGAAPSASAAPSAANVAGKDAYDRCCMRAWRSDSGATLQATEGMVVERSAEGDLRAMSLTRIEEEQAGEQALVTVTGTISKDGNATEETWVLVLDESSGAATLSSDSFEFSDTYTESVVEQTIEVEGVDEGLIGLMGGDAEPIVKTIRSFTARELPLATRVEFDGEAHIDFKKETVTATFHANDPANTVINMLYKHGSFRASK